jgi:photosystem II stability/assembly factor-like uncharacterized protein
MVAVSKIKMRKQKNKKAAKLAFASVVMLLGTMPFSRATETIDAELLDVLEWRMVGPYRGGRVTAVTGVPNKPRLYYMGATGGGIWKTENAGISWENISDGYFNVGTIGAIAVAESDSNVIYVGTGEKSIRGVTTSHGDGVYKSTDAGDTWTHIGLSNAGQISRIRIHPRNHDIAYIGVQGQIWGPSEERGVYRTMDGGESWEQVLKVDSQTGAADLRMDPSNSRILYASMWEHGRKPWFVLSGGRAGGIFKSTDGGDTWEKLTNGLPEFIGKVGVDVSASNPDRLYAIVEALPGEGGLYRSDNGGETWELKNGTRIIWGRSWYYMHIAADPVNEDIVYVLNAPFMKSIDGGATFEMQRTPHGDHHDHWINPDNNKNMISGNDGGATVTFDGGETWSSIMNQPTAQIYRVNTDNLFPYRIYSGQQDNWSLAILSETYDGGIGHDDYHQVGGGESAHFAFDPDDPTLIYGTTVNGTLTEYNANRKRVRRINPYPEYLFGIESKNLRYRTNWNAPVTASPQDPTVIYYGAEKVLQTKDRGVTFKEISPDLTKNEKDRQGLNGGPFTVENYGGEFYGTILTITASPHDYGTLWIGSDDGVIHVTRNDGESWQDVTPGNLRGAMVNSIDVSPHEPGTAYVAVAAYKMNDFRPYIYKLTDYGRRSTRLDRDLPDDNFIRVVREDPEHKGLLYAGGESGMFVSFDDGAHWQDLNVNLPTVPVTDLMVRQGDLIAATQGRGIWVLDDLSPLREATPELAEKPLHVFTPAPVEMIRPSGGPRANEGANPPRGVIVKYRIRDELDASLTIEISDKVGHLVRRYSSEEGDVERCIIGNMDQRLPFEVKYPTSKQGANQWVWDMRREGLHCIDDIKIFDGFGGAYVQPGNYQVKVSIGDFEDTIDLTLRPDPRVDAGQDQFDRVESNIIVTTPLVNELIDGVAAARKSRAELEAMLADHPDAAVLHEAGRRAIERLNEWEEQVYQVDYETYEEVGRLPGKLIKQSRHLLKVIDDAGPPLAAGALERLADLQSEWATLRTDLVAITSSDIAAVNKWARDNAIPHISPPQ